VRPNPQIEALRDAWFDAPDLPAQKVVADRIQLLGLEEPPFIPLGQYFIPYAYRSNLSGFVHAPITALWNVRRT
jgi:peptide/nickel transport system substrate-binding protein